MKNNSTNIKTYDKLGGWLILFHISFIFFIVRHLFIKPTMFFSLNQSFKILSTRSDILFIISYIFIIIGNFMIFPLMFTYFLFITKSHLFPKWFMIFRTINFSCLLIGTIISIQSNNHSISAQETTNIYSLISNILPILIIFSYLIFSKRVKGTFRREKSIILSENIFIPDKTPCNECSELNINKMIQLGLTECPKCGRVFSPQIIEKSSSNEAMDEKIKINNKETSLLKQILKSELFIATIAILIFSLLLSILAISNIIPKVLIDKSKPGLLLIWLIVFIKSLVNWVKIIFK